MEIFNQLLHLLSLDDYKNQYKNKYDYVSNTYNCYLKVDYKLLSEDDYFGYTSATEKISFLILEISNTAYIESYTKHLVELLSYFNTNNSERYALEIIRCINIIVKNNNFIENITPFQNIIIIEIEKAKLYYFSIKNFNLYRAFCEEAIFFYKKTGLTTIELLYLIGLSYHLESLDQQGRVEKSYMVKASFLEMAEAHFKSKCGNNQLAQDIRALIKPCYGFVVRNELSQVKSSTEFSADLRIELYRFKNIYMRKMDNDIVLEQISIDSHFLPNYNQIIKSTHEVYKDTLFQDLVQTTPINEKRKLGTISSENEKRDYKIFSFYELSIRMEFDLRLFPVMSGLIERKKITHDSIMKYLSRWSLVDKSRMPIFSQGFEHFFNNDNISFISIIVPQIEHQIRYMFELIGYSTTNAPDSKSQEEKTFSKFLDDPFVSSTLGIDVVKYFQFLFVSKIGFNIRNSVAHGFYDSSAFNKGMSYIVFYSLILLTRFNIKEKESV